jgi:hypothetical protein
MALPSVAKGKDGKMVVDGTTCHVQGFTFQEGGSDADVTDTEGAGVEKSLPCTTAYTGTVDALFRTDASPYKTTPNLERGTEITSLELYVTTTKKLVFPAVILGITLTSAVKDAIKWSISYQATGVPTTKPI